MSAVDTTTTVRASEHPTTTTVDGELMLLNTETGMYQGLTGVGPRVWELLREPTTVQRVVETLTDEYDVTDETCERDVLEFVRTMAEEELVEVDP
ncbi:MAG: PqqD family peptide modification chaperone [Halobacteriota archaeon]|uniref:PqqD family peptide modification chaperone n=1 Tax=Natronomonas sp. TaxID=2184060 RepID=UPI0039748644